MGAPRRPRDTAFRREYDRLVSAVLDCLSRHADYDGTINNLFDFKTGGLVPVVANECSISEDTTELIIHRLCQLHVIISHPQVGKDYYLSSADQKSRDREEYRRSYPERIIRQQFERSAVRRRLRKEIADGLHICAQCATEDNLTVDHIVPVNNGGTNDIDNLQVLCKSCNSRKGARV